MTLSNKVFELNNGKRIPSVGLGTWESEKSEEAVKIALNAGYRHIDCAAVYGNEDKIGKALKESGIKRDNLFITSKLWLTEFKPEKVEKACRKTLSDLKLDYLDLYLIHWPIAIDEETSEPRPHLHINVSDTWKEMEKLVDQGLVKSIGVSNFNIASLKKLLGYCRIKPVVNQVELHPFLRQDDLLEYAKEVNIHLTAYSPLARNKDPSIAEDGTILKIASKYDKTPAQVALNWAVQRGTSVVPKSENEGRIKENFEQFELSEEDMNLINQIKTHVRVCTSDFLGIDVFNPQWK